MSRKRLRVGVIGTLGYPARYGGFETLVANLVAGAPDDVEYIVYSQASHFPGKKRTQHGHHRVRYLPFLANGAQSFLFDLVSMVMALFSTDKLLILGVSGCLALPVIRLVYRGEIVTNIDGLEWKRDKWNLFAKGVLWLSEVFAVHFSHRVVADNAAIVEHVRRAYRRKSELIAYGGDQHRIVVPRQPDFAAPLPQGGFALAVSRIEPENHVEWILEAARRRSQPLVYVGNWRGSKFAQSLHQKYSGCSCLLLVTDLYDPAALAWLRTNTWIYVHGHSAGGTNPSLVEAMSHSAPVVAFDCRYNRATTDDRALYFDSVSSLEDLFQSLPRGREALKDLSEAMYELARSRYRWEQINEQYVHLFRKP